MSRALTRAQLACTYGVDELEVEYWVHHGCPCTRIRRDLVLFDDEEVTRWCADRGLARRPPLIDDLLPRLRSLQSIDEVDELSDDVEVFVARGALSRARASILREYLARTRLRFEGECQEDW